jgi:hypothetical protein
MDHLVDPVNDVADFVQTRTQVLNGDLETTFRRWYPGFSSAAA